MFRKQLLKEVGAGNMLLAKLNVNFANSIFIMSSNFNIEQLENSIFVGECNGRKRHVLLCCFGELPVEGSGFCWLYPSQVTSIRDVSGTKHI